MMSLARHIGASIGLGFLFGATLMPAYSGAPVLVISTAKSQIGFYDEGLDFPDHETADEKELSRHEERPMSDRAIAADTRRRLQDQLNQQELTAASSAFRAEFGSGLELVDVGQQGPEATPLFASGATSWHGAAANILERIQRAADGSRPVILIRVDDVSHGTGRFIVHKSMAHYFCVDTAAEARVALPDGRLTPLHRARTCRNEMFHPDHEESFYETSHRQITSLQMTFERLARKLAADLQRTEGRPQAHR